MKSSILAGLTLVAALSAFGVAQAAVNPNAPSFSSSQGSGSNGGVPSVGAVPEPATWALMLVGAALVGGSLRGRRAAAKA